MRLSSLSQCAAPWLLAAALLTSGLAMAQAEPTLNQIYATAQAGKLDEAQVMVQQVLISHPQSAKAHYVRAELYAREGKLDRARESLATAEKLSPGLAFAKPQAVQALRAQLSARKAQSTTAGSLAGEPVRSTAPANGVGSISGAQTATPATQPSSPSWGLPLVLTGVVLVAGYLFFRRREAASAPQPAGHGPHGGLSGPQGFGMGGAAALVGYPPTGGYPPAGGSGMGGRILGGVATGLAVGAGVMAAEALGRNLMGHHANADNGRLDGGGAHNNTNDYRPLDNASNPDMGGADFGINDGGSWDSGGGLDGGGGGSDWDS